MDATILPVAGTIAGVAAAPAVAAPLTFGAMLLDRCGLFTWPLLLLSISVWALGIARLLRTRIDSDAALLERLAGLSVSFGLLGTVAGMISAFGSGEQSEGMTRAIAIAYWTTGFGIINAIAASVFGLRQARSGEAKP